MAVQTMPIRFFPKRANGPVKVGITHVGHPTHKIHPLTIDSRRRQIELASGRRMVVLGDVDGLRIEETKVLARFRHLRTFGEWLRPGPDLLQFIARVIAGQERL